jgi:hypothetical protein
MIWIIIELLAASFAMGMWVSNVARRQTVVGFLWIAVCLIIIYSLSEKL